MLPDRCGRPCAGEPSDLAVCNRAAFLFVGGGGGHQLD
jgi:hypothetical protein